MNGFIAPLLKANFEFRGSHTYISALFAGRKKRVEGFQTEELIHAVQVSGVRTTTNKFEQHLKWDQITEMYNQNKPLSELRTTTQLQNHYQNHMRKDKKRIAERRRRAKKGWSGNF